ncbi:MAG: tRNA uridine-5-carboxymethylaminomethyl(34) synthesis GTPase MnmE [Edaphocola sp.]
MLHQDTIVALTTAVGGALGLVRISGTEAISIAGKMFEGKDLAQQKTHTLHFGTLHTATGELMDEVLVSVFKNTHSYTGEHTVEISAHGSPYILGKIVGEAIRLGARAARPGEFTQRAFFNGKMDLAQAEAIADLIASENKASHEIALNQMRGGVSSELEQLREQLINFTALIELELDFSDEDVEFADRSQLKILIQNLQTKIQNLIQSFEYGNAIKNGVPVAIIGKPNAGKSTLLNALLKEERAIVSEIAGTTRDVIEEAITLDGITFRFIDTAGIRDTEDTIEAIGVRRAKEKVRQAKVVIHLYEDDDSLLGELSESLEGKIVFNLQSKCDNAMGHAPLPTKNQIHFPISVKENINLDKLTNELVAHFKNENATQSVIISNIRHKEALEKSLAALIEVENGMAQNLSGDLLSLHLKDALYHIGTITGKIDVDKDILGAIFGKFCIGK